MSEVIRKAPQLEGARFKLAESVRNHWVVTAQPDTQPDDLLAPAYFAHVAEKMRPGDRVDVIADDNTWFAQLLVVATSRSWAKLHRLSQHDLDAVSETAEEALSPYELKFRGPHSKWSVIRKADGQVVHEKEDDKAGAAKWLAERLKAER